MKLLIAPYRPRPPIDTSRDVQPTRGTLTYSYDHQIMHLPRSSATIATQPGAVERAWLVFAFCPFAMFVPGNLLFDCVQLDLALLLTHSTSSEATLDACIDHIRGSRRRACRYKY
jgi:hypothetical protein